VRINGKQLIKLAAEKNVSIDQLGQAVARVGLPASRAASAVRNWMGDRDHPRCKASDIARLADVLGVSPSRLARFECIFKYHRGSPRKVKLLVDLIRGKDFDTARNLLTFTTKRAAVDVSKALMGAYADAEQANADLGALVVSVSRVDDGPRLKRFQQKDRGRAHRILKRMSHITVAVEEKASA
jgi:large subunit ribosomal protein L22